MRKTLFVLLFLLFLLIIACVYQKTYTLYSMQTIQEEEPVVVINENQANSVDKKDIKTVVKETVKEKRDKKEDIQTVVNHVTTTPSIPKHEVKTSHEEVAKTKTITSPASSTKEVQKETSLLEKTQAKATKTFAPSIDGEKEEKVITVEKIVSHTPEVPKEEIKKVETEATDYLLTVLKEHDAALSERDAAESRLHALIKKVLEERKQAINAMEEVAASSDKVQTIRIEKRDQVSQTIIDNQTKGE